MLQNYKEYIWYSLHAASWHIQKTILCFPVQLTKDKKIMPQSVSDFTTVVHSQHNIYGYYLRDDDNTYEVQQFHLAVEDTKYWYHQVDQCCQKSLTQCCIPPGQYRHDDAIVASNGQGHQFL
jgi:hypothetical protein